jgi:hypothetical protein
MFRILYYLKKRLASLFKNVYLDITKPTSFIKGDEFELFLRKKIYRYPDYELVMKTHSYGGNKGDFIEMTKYPDYLFRDKSGKEFYVEAKYRESLFKDKLDWCKPYQLKRYKEIGIDKEIFIAIGLGGRPKYPKRLFIVPLEKINFHSLYEREYVPYERVIPKRGIFDQFKDYLYN